MAKENVDGQQELVEKYLSESGGNIFCRDASNPSELCSTVEDFWHWTWKESAAIETESCCCGNLTQILHLCSTACISTKSNIIWPFPTVNLRKWAPHNFPRWESYAGMQHTHVRAACTIVCAANARARSLTQQVVRGRWWKGNGGR